jgi:FlaA1/EpsC-like NDP-sugar epimerase
MLPKIRAYTPPEQLLFVGPATRLSRRYMSWFTIDLIITFFAIGITGLIWRIDGPLDVGWPRAIAGAIGFSLLFSITGALMGLNRIAWSQASNSDVFGLVPAWVLATLIGFLANLYLGIFPSSLILMASGLALIGFVTVRYRSRLLGGLLRYMLRTRHTAQAARERVLIVGTGPTAQLAIWLLNHPANMHRYWVVGVINDDLFKQGMRVYGVQILGKSNDLPRLIIEHDVGVVISTDPNIVSSKISDLIDRSRRPTVRFILLPDIFAALNGLDLDAMPEQLIDNMENDQELNHACRHCLAKLARLDMTST